MESWNVTLYYTLNKNCQFEGLSDVDKIDKYIGESERNIKERYLEHLCYLELQYSGFILGKNCQFEGSPDVDKRDKYIGESERNIKERYLEHLCYLELQYSGFMLGKLKK